MKLTARRDPENHIFDSDHRHRGLLVAGPTIAWPDVDDDTLRAMMIEQNDTLGVLARIAVQVGPQLLVTGREHTCDYLPRRNANYGDDEIPRATSPDGCSLYLHACLDTGDHMPHLGVNVPRDRENSWLAYLTDVISAVTRETVDALTA